VKKNLRQQAEKIARGKAAPAQESIEALSPEVARQTLHELGVHQIELEIQNEELRRAQAELEASKARYFDLYDLAPVGYCTISEKGLILEANLTAASLLGLKRQNLVNQLLVRFISKDDQDLYYLHRKPLFESGTPQAFELRMVKKDGTLFWVQLTASAVKGVDGAPMCYVVLHDITERKLVELYGDIGREVLQILSEPDDLKHSLRRVLAVLKSRTGLDAVGIRLQDGDDFPYFAQNGFSTDFLLTENTLIDRGADGRECRDEDGNVRLECTCGLVISGKVDPSSPLVTRGGSFWTNNLFPLPDIPPGQDPRHHPRNQCIHQGYASVALVPIRSREGIVGLLQFNDRRKGCFTVLLVELLEVISARLGAALLRQQVEAALRESRDAINHAQAIAHIGSWSHNLQNHVLHWSDENYRILGVSRDMPLLYETFLNAVHPEDRTRVHETWTAALRGKHYDVEHRIVVGGTIKWVHNCAELMCDEQGIPSRWVGTTQDITDRKHADEAVRQASARELEAMAIATASNTARDALDAMNEGVLLASMTGTILSTNPALERMSSQPADLIVGLSAEAFLARLIVPEDRSLMVDWLRRAMCGEDGGIQRFSAFISGARMPVICGISFIRSFDGKPSTIVVTLRDMSELHSAQMTLEKSEQKYRELVENANSIIMRITPDHTITFFNEYAQTFFGYKAQEVVGRNVLGTIAPELDSEGRDLRPMFQKISAHQELHGVNENENVCRDGRRVWVHWTNRALRDDQGNMVEILCVGTDITRRREMEAEALRYQKRLRELTEQLATSEEQDRWRISRTIHDTIIQNLSLSIIRLGTMEGSLTEAKMTEEASRLRQIRNLLDQASDECRTVMSELTPALLYELGLIPALNDLAQQMAAKHGTRITVEGGNPETPMSNPLRGFLFESVRELIMNATKYAGPCEVRVAVNRHDGVLAISVADDGRGFDLSNANVRLDHKGGFGLFNIRQRLEGLGGHLAVESAPGKGTTATIRVPAQ
jgi:PAS domain S-box-containing protein